VRGDVRKGKQGLLCGKNLVKVLGLPIVLLLILLEGRLGYRRAIGQVAPITIGTIYEATGPVGVSDAMEQSMSII
jgi:hypothetical protein